MKKRLLILFRLLYLIVFGLIALLFYPVALILELFGYNPASVVYMFTKFDRKIKKTTKNYYAEDN